MPEKHHSRAMRRFGAPSSVAGDMLRAFVPTLAGVALIAAVLIHLAQPAPEWRCVLSHPEVRTAFYDGRPVQESREVCDAFEKAGK